jgi:autophagy-related protein 9
MFTAFTIYFIYRYITEYHNNPKAIGLFSFTPTAKWKLRDFNELPHVYMSRLIKARPKIVEYLAQYVNYEFTIVIKFFSFIIGTLFFILILISFLNPNIIISVVLLEKPVIFYVSIIGAIYLLLKNVTENYDEKLPVYEPNEKFNELVKVLHYTPSAWDALDTKERYIEIRHLFRYKWIILVQEIISVFYIPVLFIRWYYLPNQARKIVNFFRENSVHVDKLGLICTNANFNFNRKKKEVITLDPFMNLKMSNSLINFKNSYTWDPNRKRDKGKGKERIVQHNYIYNHENEENEENEENGEENEELLSPVTTPTPTIFYDPTESDLYFNVPMSPTNSIKNYLKDQIDEIDSFISEH